MGFVKEFRKIKDEFPEWDYLDKIGVRNMLGESIDNWTRELVVDRENNYYLIPQGHTSFGRDGIEINYYALCVNDKVINMQIDALRSGNGTDKTFECHWIIKEIEFPKGWTFDYMSKKELKHIIYNAFVAETYSRVLTQEKVKTITVDFNIPFDGNGK